MFTFFDFLGACFKFFTNFTILYYRIFITLFCESQSEGEGEGEGGGESFYRFRPTNLKFTLTTITMVSCPLQQSSDGF